MTSDSEAFGELYPAIYRVFCRRWTPDEYRPSAEAAAILEHLASTGPLTVSEAAQHFGRSQAATSELVNRLERRDLIARMPDERDARRHLVWLTQAGREVCARLGQVLDGERLAAAFDALTPEVRETLLNGMRALLSAAPTPTRESPITEM